MPSELAGGAVIVLIAPKQDRLLFAAFFIRSGAESEKQTTS